MGIWSVNWLAELDKHVKPEIAAEVKNLMLLLMNVRHHKFSITSCL